MADDLLPPIFDPELCKVLVISPSTLKRRTNPRAYVFPLQPLPSIDKRRRWSRAEVARYLAGETRGALALARRRA